MDEALRVAWRNAGVSRAARFASAFASADQVEAAFTEVAADTRAFPSTEQAVAYFIASTFELRLAHEAMNRVGAELSRLVSLANEERATYRRMGNIAARDPRFGADFATVEAPRARRPGRRDEVALRDLTVRTFVELYPKKGLRADAWAAGRTIAALLWPRLRHVDWESLRRDMRRRRGAMNRSPAVALLMRQRVSLMEAVIRECFDAPSAETGH